MLDSTFDLWEFARACCGQQQRYLKVALLSATVCTECFLHQGDRNIVFFSASALTFLTLEWEEFPSTVGGYTHILTPSQVPAVWPCGHFDAPTTNQSCCSILLESTVHTLFIKRISWDSAHDSYSFPVLQINRDKTASVYSWIEIHPIRGSEVVWLLCEWTLPPPFICL